MTALIIVYSGFISRTDFRIEEKIVDVNSISADLTRNLNISFFEFGALLYTHLTSKGYPINVVVLLKAYKITCKLSKNI